MRSFRLSLIATVAVSAIVLSACGATPAPTASPSAGASQAPASRTPVASATVAPSIAAPSASPDPGTWTATGGLITARSGHSATRLLDGRVLVTGQGPAELYDPISGTWSPTGGTGPSPDGPATLLLDGHVLVGSEEYDPSAGTWESRGAMTTNRGIYATVLLTDGSVLAPGGFGSEGFIWSTAEIYDPRILRWAAVGNMTASRGYESATRLLDGRVLVAGGLSFVNQANGDRDTRAVATAELFDPNTGAWTPTGSMHAPRSQFAAVLLADGRVLVAGGEGPDGSLDSAELYDPRTGAWLATGAMTSVRLDPKAVPLKDGSVLVVGGEGAPNALGIPAQLASAEIYHPATGTWAATAAMSMPRGPEFTATALADGRVLVGGGVGENGLTASAELYTTEGWQVPAPNVEPCGTGPTTVDRILASDPGCFGSRDIHITGWLAPPWGIGGTSLGIEPSWLEPLAFDLVLWLKQRNPAGCFADDDCVWLFLYVRPGSGVTLAAPERWVRLTGHYADPAAETCRWNGNGTAMTPDEVIRLCRREFVVTAVEDAPAP